MTIIPDSCRMETISHAAGPAGSSDPSVCASDLRHQAALTLPFSPRDSLSMTAACATLPVPISISCRPTTTISACLERFPSHELRLYWLGCCSLTFHVPASTEMVRRCTICRSFLTQYELSDDQPSPGMAADHPVTVPLAAMENTRVPTTTIATIAPRCASQVATREPVPWYTTMLPSLSPAHMHCPTAARHVTADFGSSCHRRRPPVEYLSTRGGRYPNHREPSRAAATLQAQRAPLSLEVADVAEAAPAVLKLSGKSCTSTAATFRRPIEPLPAPALPLPPPRAFPRLLPNLLSIWAPFFACSVLRARVFAPPIDMNPATFRTAPRLLST
mmetsp:Transcript_31868/g.75690  ORF Transcript_31868/g.75690 Transcript_31868/m.75690 type:complete len:332 (+) Transcript_31868:91-1086(+)